MLFVFHVFSRDTISTVGFLLSGDLRCHSVIGASPLAPVLWGEGEGSYPTAIKQTKCRRIQGDSQGMNNEIVAGYRG